MKKYIAKLLICALCVSSISLPVYANDGISTNRLQQEMQAKTV